MPDYGSTADEPSQAARLRRKARDYSAYREAGLPFSKRDSMKLPVSLLEGQEGFSLQFFTRMLYSCLVDADFLDTERVMDRKKAHVRGSEHPTIPELRQRLDQHLAKLLASAEDTPVNRYRGDILKACVDRAELNPG